ncbi:MAG: methyltransferase domain-containing protein [Acidobacteria bacterium]|nr:methyltransferase domain-containing protein [Acidobacteriota bacterium]
MKVKKVERVSPRQGYDLWSETYDQTPNPVVAMDARHTVKMLAPQVGEQILDAGCGTGRNLQALLAAGSQPIGIDLSMGMLKVAKRRWPTAPLAVADLQKPYPFRASQFDAALCALIGEHLDDLPTTFRQLQRVLKPSGRLIFSVYHPEMAAAGKEAHFQKANVEYRLGAVRHTVSDYLNWLDDAGFVNVSCEEFVGDGELAAMLPEWSRYMNFPVLLAIVASKRS